MGGFGLSGVAVQVGGWGAMRRAKPPGEVERGWCLPPAGGGAWWEEHWEEFRAGR